MNSFKLFPKKKGVQVGCLWPYTLNLWRFHRRTGRLKKLCVILTHLVIEWHQYVSTSLHSISWSWNRKERKPHNGQLVEGNERSRLNECYFIDNHQINWSSIHARLLPIRRWMTDPSECPTPNVGRSFTWIKFHMLRMVDKALRW